MTAQAGMSEADLQRAAIECARLLGWQVAHFRPARTARGWRTPVQADGAGFPDLVLVHPSGRLLVRELKSDRGRLTVEQEQWLELLTAAGVDADVWRPADWLGGRIEAELRGTVERRAARPARPGGPEACSALPSDAIRWGRARRGRLMATATTVRLPDELDERLASYCAQTGAVKNRVVALALRAYLDDGPVPALAVQPPDGDAAEAVALP